MSRKEHRALDHIGERDTLLLTFKRSRGENYYTTHKKQLFTKH